MRYEHVQQKVGDLRDTEASISSSQDLYNEISSASNVYGCCNLWQIQGDPGSGLTRSSLGTRRSRAFI